jgi:hypothetical protein
MGQVTIEIDGHVDEESVETLLEASSGFFLENRGVGRSRRYSHIGDVIKVIGEIGSVAGFAKTLWELLKLGRAGSQETTVRIRSADGRTTTISTKDAHAIPDIVKALRTLESDGATP